MSRAAAFRLSSVLPPRRPRGGRTGARGRCSRRYFALLGRHHYAAALAPPAERHAAGRFAAAFRPYLSYHGHVARAGGGRRRGGSSYTEVPVRIEGRLRNGRRFSERGSVTLRMVHPIPGATAAERRWHIYRTDMFAPRFRLSPRGLFFAFPAALRWEAIAPALLKVQPMPVLLLLLCSNIFMTTTRYGI